MVAETEKYTPWWTKPADTQDKKLSRAGVDAILREQGIADALDDEGYHSTLATLYTLPHHERGRDSNWSVTDFLLPAGQIVTAAPFTGVRGTVTSYHLR